MIGVDVDMARRSLDQIRTAMAAREASTDDLRCQTEICAALCTVQTTAVAGEELRCWRNDWCG